jgi:hypothetical protein
VLILCSFWAGLSRINWYPVPALIAILLYLLEVPYGGKFLRYFWRPLVWFLAGLGVAVMTHWGYERLSGNPSAWFGTSLTSQLLWYRLLPNSTYPPGILLASWIVILPMGFLLYNRWTHQRLALQPWPWLGILAILLGLYLGGLVVSVKIGGGSNLHNLDAFWMGFGIVFVSLMTQSNGNDNSSLDDLLNRQAWGIFRNEQSMKMALVATLVIPGLFLLLSIQPFVHPNWGAAEKALSSLQNLVSDLPAGREVLFISERQLLTFGYLRGVKLVPEYERVFLMEMAMANNQSYLQQFYRDLRAHRFALIINEPLRTKIKGKPLRFGEENDAWVKRVSKPLLCYYKPLQQDRLFLATLGIQVLEPRPKLPADCTQ